MTRYRRNYVEGGTYFFTLVTERRYPIFRNPAAILHLRDAFGAVIKDWPFTIDAIVILPDHLHAVWTLPEGDGDYSTRWRLIKAQFSHRLPFNPPRSESRRRQREKGIWQRRFWEHAIRNGDDLRRHVEYIHYNPVKHGHVARPIDWPWGSFRRDVAKGLFSEDWGSSTEPVDIRGMDPE